MKSIDKYLFPNIVKFRGKSAHLDYGHRLNSNTINFSFSFRNKNINFYFSLRGTFFTRIGWSTHNLPVTKDQQHKINYRSIIVTYYVKGSLRSPGISRQFNFSTSPTEFSDQNRRNHGRKEAGGHDGGPIGHRKSFR